MINSISSKLYQSRQSRHHAYPHYQMQQAYVETGPSSYSNSSTLSKMNQQICHKIDRFRSREQALRISQVSSHTIKSHYAQASTLKEQPTKFKHNYGSNIMQNMQSPLMASSILRLNDKSPRSETYNIREISTATADFAKKSLYTPMNIETQIVRDSNRGKILNFQRSSAIQKNQKEAKEDFQFFNFDEDEFSKQAPAPQPAPINGSIIESTFHMYDAQQRERKQKKEMKVTSKPYREDNIEQTVQGRESKISSIVKIKTPQQQYSSFPAPNQEQFSPLRNQDFPPPKQGFVHQLRKQLMECPREGKLIVGAIIALSLILLLLQLM